MANLIISIKIKTCALDPVPASVLTKCLPISLPVITNKVNRSLPEACMPNTLRCAMIAPLLKKSYLDPEEIKNFF